MNVLLTIAQLTPESRMKVLVALAIMMVLVMVGGFAILMFRRRLRAEDDDSDGSASVGFSLSDLREMRDRGEITAEEYEITKARVIDKVKSSLATPAKKMGKPPKGLDLPGLGDDQS